MPVPIRVLSFLLVLSLSSQTRADCLAPYWDRLTTVEVAALDLAVADLDADGDADLIASNATTVYFAANTGGTFAAPVTIHTGTIARGIVVAELTGGGGLDVAVATSTALAVIPGNGDGTFAPAVTTVLDAAPLRIAGGALNGDAITDLAIFTASAVKMFLATGGGAFTQSASASAPSDAQSLLIADLDNDAAGDVVVGSPANALQIHYGNGDGTFDPVVLQPSFPYLADLTAADLNADGHLDLVGADAYSYTVVLRNLGTRMFGDPLYFITGSNANAIATADFTGDAILDTVTATTGLAIATHRGSGTSALGAVTRWFGAVDRSRYAGLADVVAARFDADARIDVAITVVSEAAQERSRIEVLRNRCGDSVITVAAPEPVITTGNPATIQVRVDPPPEGNSRAVEGTVTLMRGETVVGTQTLASRKTTFTVADLPAGEHTFTATYAGDTQHEPNATSTTAVQRVTNEQTTIHFTLGGGPAITYAEYVPWDVSVTSSLPGTPTGKIHVRLDESYTVTESAPAATGAINAGNPGDHTLTIDYTGDATHPPRRLVVPFTTEKAPVALSLSTSGGSNFLVFPNGVNGATLPSGTISISEDGTLLGSGAIASIGYATIPKPALATGRHFLRIEYPGDARYAASKVETLHYVFPPNTATIDARGNADGVLLTWSAPELVIIRSRIGRGPITGGMCCSSGPWLASAVPDTVYVFSMETHGGGAAIGNADVGVRTTFTDDPVWPGMSVRAIHLQEIVTGANRLRTAAGLPPLAMQIASGTPVSAEQLTTLRNAINDARVALGALPYPFDTTLHAGAAVRATHVRDLREAIR